MSHQQVIFFHIIIFTFNNLKFELGIRSIKYTSAASGEAKIRSAAWEKVDIPGLVTTGFTHM